MIRDDASSLLSPAGTSQSSIPARLLILAVAVGAAVFTAASSSLMAAVVALATVAAVVVAVVPQSATFAFVFLLYINAPGVATQVHGVPQLVAGLFIGLLVIPLAALMLRRQPIVILPVLVLASLYGLAMLLSTLQAMRLEPALRGVLTHATEGLLLIFLVTNVVRTERTLRAALCALLLAGAFLAAVSLHQELTGSYAATYGGFALFPEGAVPSGDVEARLGGPLADPNRYAQILLMLLPIAAYAVYRAQFTFARALGSITGAMVLPAIYLTQSRGAAVAVGGMFVAGLVTRVIPLRLGLLIVIVLMAGLVMTGFEDVGRILSLPELQPTPDAEGNVDLSPLARVTLNLAAWNVFVDHTVLGIGPGNFPLVAVEYGNELGLRHFSASFRAHNLYLEIAAETGILGLAAFLCLLGYLSIRLWQVRMESRLARPESAAIATALLFALAAYALTGVFLHLSFERYLWVIVALSGAAVAVLRQRSSEPAAAVPT